MSEPHLIYEKREHIAHIVFNRPDQRNALSPEAFCWLAVRKTKETVLRTLSLGPEEAFAIEGENFAVTLASDDAKEGPRAFVEKRAPCFRGR